MISIPSWSVYFHDLYTPMICIPPWFMCMIVMNFGKFSMTYLYRKFTLVKFIIHVQTTCCW